MSDPAKTAPVLVAVDFSPDSEAALLWACEYASLVNAPIILLHVVHDPAYAPGFYRKDETSWSRPMSDMADEMFEKFVSNMQANHKDVSCFSEITKMQVIGLPASRIIEAAILRQARLIVVGSRGRTGLSHIFLGSVAERVVQTSTIPVTVVKALNKKDKKREKKIRKKVTEKSSAASKSSKTKEVEP